MKALSPIACELLRDAHCMAAELICAGVAADGIIRRLQSHYGAKLVLSAATNRLTCATVSATCTWSTDKGLLDAWLRAAAKRLAAIAEATDA